MSAVEFVSATSRAEATILYIARVSSDQANEDTKLLRWLIDEGHWSPFMLVHAVFGFRTSRAVSHQMIRHWTMVCMEHGEVPGVQEFSQRYAETPGWIVYGGRYQGERNRQVGSEFLSQDDGEWWERAQNEVASHANRIYRDALGRGIARESARFVLPESTETNLYLAGSLRSWIHYLGDAPGGRGREDVQAEHRELALEARGLFAGEFPVISNAVGWVESQEEVGSGG